MPVIIEGKRGQLADLLFQVGAIKIATQPGDGFRMKLHEKNPDAPLSPIYLNLRTAQHPKNPGPLTEEMMEIIGDLFAEELASIEFDHFADLPNAGEPFGDEVERVVRTRDPVPARLRLRKIEHSDGSREITSDVGGEHADGASALLVDEMITKADTKFEGIRALEAAGLKVKYVLVLADREHGGEAQLRKQGYHLLKVLTLGELLDHYVSRGFIDQAKANEVRDYIANN